MTYDQVGEDDLQNLCGGAGLAFEDTLQDPDEHVAHGSRDKGAKGGHLRDARGKVVAVTVAVIGKVRGE